MCKSLKGIADKVAAGDYSNLSVSASKLRGEVHMYLTVSECDEADLNNVRLLTIFVQDDEVLDMEDNDLLQWMLAERKDVVLDGINVLADIYSVCSGEYCGVNIEDLLPEPTAEDEYQRTHGGEYGWPQDDIPDLE